MTSVPPPDPPTPPHRGNLARLAVVGVVILLVAAVAVFVLVRGDGDTPSAGKQEPIDSVKGAVPIRMSDGVELGAQVTTPTGRGRHPLVIMPSSYGATSAEYEAVARVLTGAGYVTVSYTQRGFHNSGGSIDLAGARTQRDARAVIDWALAHTPADPAHVGMLGVSYGAGISLLTAAHDRRVRAVVALSGWADLAAAFHPNDTTSVPGLTGLLTHPRADDELDELAATLKPDPFARAGALTSFARARSPITYLRSLDANRPAIMLASGWQDSLLPPAQLVPFFERLRTPKRLQLAPGDHGGPESAMLAGRRSRTGDAAFAWLEHYVAGKDNGIEHQRPIALEDVTTHAVQGFAAWPGSASGSSRRDPGGDAQGASTVGPKYITQPLAAPRPGGVTIRATAKPWSARIRVGSPADDTAARVGASQFVPTSGYRVPTARPSELPADKSFVWSSGAVGAPVRVVGSTRLSVSIASSAPQATLFVYQYDVGRNNTGALMTMTPYTATRLDAARSKPVTVDLDPIDWTLAAGHHVSVVIDTVEPRWWQGAPAGSQLQLSSDAQHRAQVSFPVG